MTVIMECICTGKQEAFLNKTYGKNKRVFNSLKSGGFRCANCGKEKTYATK